MKKEFSETLKELRLNAGYSQKQVYDILGIKQSTFSAWETGRAEPSADMLLKLCKLYKVNDILSAFGYDGYDADGRLILNMHEIEMVEKYRALDEHGKELIDSILDKEYQRCLLPLSGQPTIFDIISPEDLAELEKAAQHSDMHFSDDFDKFIKSFSSLFPFSEENEFEVDATHNDHLDESGEQENMQHEN